MSDATRPSDPHPRRDDVRAAPAVGTLASITVHPIKSAAGISVDAAEVHDHGLALDRRWMLVDRDGTFLSQRTVPRMALVRPEIGAHALAVRAPGMPTLELALRPDGGRATHVSIWEDAVEAWAVDGEADAWFSRFLGREARLVYVPEEGLRQVDPAYAAIGDRVGFADGYPFLLASEASLADLNRRLPTPVAMARFRPNLVVRGFEPFAEDGWRRVRIGDVAFRVVKPCARCAITTVDPETAEVGKEPLRTLAGYRRVDGKVLFAQNLVHDGRGVLRTGDRVVVEG